MPGNINRIFNKMENGMAKEMKRWEGKCEGRK